MKRPLPAIRRRIIEVQGPARSSRIDPRADPLATTKISRAELDAVLNRTVSGTRPVVRYDEALPRAQEPIGDEWPGPRDDAPEITIRKIESVEIDIQGNPMLEAPASPRAPPSSPHAPPPSPRSPSPLTPAPFVMPAVTSPVREFSPHTPTAIERSPEVLPRSSWRRRVALTVLVVLLFVAALTATFLAGRFTAL